MKAKKTYYEQDNELVTYCSLLNTRENLLAKKREELIGKDNSLEAWANGYLYFGQHGGVFREYAPNATAIFLVGDFNSWQEDDAFSFKSITGGRWELDLEGSDYLLKMEEGMNYMLSIHWHGGKDIRIPAYAKHLRQDDVSKNFCATLLPIEGSVDYEFKHTSPKIETPLIYEAHIGMSSEEEKVSTFDEFRKDVLPYIAQCGYNTIQLMAIQEHPYYGSYGYHVANFFAVSSRFGTPDDLKHLVDDAHSLGLAVIMDLVHSHSVKNEKEGLACYDGNDGLYFHTGERRFHKAWDSLCFNYGSNAVLHFLLSNCKYWIEEYKMDGFRFDGVTSMLYKDHGLGKSFTKYEDYFNDNFDVEAWIYLALSNELIHNLNPFVLCIAEEMSGLPGLCASRDSGGTGFDYRLAMGVPDYWIKLCKDYKDEDWEPGDIFFQLTSKRKEERTINYAESHDQALVGDKTLIMHLLGSEIYTHMHHSMHSLTVDRGMALHKMIRLVTFGLAQGGYLNFMGNEFGHPEWIDFPREGNGWQYKYARRQWTLQRNENLRYFNLAEFDKRMMNLQTTFHFMNSSCECVYDDRRHQILAFRRDNLLFVFNFHPTISHGNFGMLVTSGEYNIVLSSDSKIVGGFDQVDTEYCYNAKSGVLEFHLPCRTALVFIQL